MAWVEALPDWANVSVFGQVLWKWCILLLPLVLAVAAVRTVFRWGRRTSWDGSFSSYRRYLSTPLVIVVLAWFLWWLATHQINATGFAAEVFNYIFRIARGFAGVWIAWLTARWITDAIIASPEISPQSLDASLLRLVARVVAFLGVFVLVFRVAHDIGVPVYGLVAGAGVGGIAIALAARSTLENFIGTLNLYADRPVRVGEFCRYGEDPSPGWLRIGTVEEIGLRSTRIRGIDRTVTTIPNADFCNMHIISLTARDRMLFNKTIRLRYSTTPEQLRRLLTEIREMLLAHPRVSNEPARVRAVGLGPYSLDLQIFAYVMTADWNDFLAVQEELIIRITDMINKVGTAFAIPAQTVYYSPDPELNRDEQDESHIPLSVEETK
jgi:MscS family membrane protein